MIYQADIAVDTLRDVVAMFTFYPQRESTSVLEQYDLVLLLQRLIHSIDESLAEVSLHGLATCLHPKVIDDDFWHLDAAVTFRYGDEMIFVLSCVIIRFEGRRSRAHQEASVKHLRHKDCEVASRITRCRVDLLERTVVFLIDDNQS